MIRTALTCNDVKTGNMKQPDRLKESDMKRLLLAAMLLLSANSHAAWEDGNELHDGCNKEGMFLGYCYGYITGTLDANTSAIFRPYCLPEGATQGQMWDLVKKWLADNPAYRAIPADRAVTAAMMEAFPPKRSWRTPAHIDDDGEYQSAKYSVAANNLPDGKWVAGCGAGQEYIVDGWDLYYWGRDLPDKLKETLKIDRYNIGAD